MIIREARLEDAEGIAKVYVDGWRTTYPGIVSDEHLAKMSYEDYTRHWARILSTSDGFLYVAEDETGNIAGFIWGGPEHNGDTLYKGELHAIYILKTHQGKGLGRLLIRVLAEKLLEVGIEAMIVWVLAANSSREFYEKLGAKFVRTGPYRVGDVTLEDLGYGWTDIRVLLSDAP
jgi:GNAT superfamily N-acetyltransferase